MGKLARRLSEYGLSTPESETPEERFERERLEKRIAEEAGPVRTFKAVEELVPEKGRRGTMGVSIRKHGMYLLAAVTRHLDISQPPPSLNAMQRMHWAQRMEITDTWAEEIAVAAIEAGQPRFRRAEVRLRLYYR